MIKLVHFLTGSILCVKKSEIRRGKLETSLATRGIFLGCTSTSRNSIYHDTITKETKISIHFGVDEAHHASKTQRPSYDKHLINNNKDKLISNLKSFDSPDNHLANAMIVISQHSQVMPSELHLTNAHDSPSCHVAMPIKGNHLFLGMQTSPNNSNRIIIDNVAKKTPACRLLRWRTTIRGATILKINGTKIDNETHFRKVLNKCILVKLKTISLEKHPFEKINTHIDSTSPQILFDHMSIMAHQHNAESSNTAEWTDPHNHPPMAMNNICNIINNLS